MANSCHTNGFRWKKVLAADVNRSLVHNDAVCARLRVLVAQSKAIEQDNQEPADLELLRMLFKYSNAVLKKLLHRLKMELYAQDNTAFNFEVGVVAFARRV